MADEVLKLRFDLGDAERMKGEESAPEQPVVLEVEVAALEPELRALLSTRMVRGAKGVFDVCRMKDPFEREFRRASREEFLAGVPTAIPVRIRAKELTLEGLKQALREDAKRLE